MVARLKTRVAVRKDSPAGGFGEDSKGGSMKETWLGQ